MENLQSGVARGYKQEQELQYIEIGLEHAPFVVLVYFFPHLNMQKTC